MSCRRSGDERDNGQLNVGREPAVQGELSATRGLASLDGRKIEIREANRLLELVHAIAPHLRGARHWFRVGS
jgi:hypothetical protein